MRRVLTLSAVLVLASAWAFAETFSGRLVDAACAAQQKNAACNPTANTASFALEVSGKMLRLDADGNQKAADALKQSNSGADRAKDPNAANSQVTATVQGVLNGDEIKVEAIAVR